MIGENVVKYPKVVSREAEEGHIIGNHTYSHVDLTKMSQEMTECELGKTNTAIEEITGKKTEYMRPPYGAWKKEMEENTGMIAVLWNVDPLDWNTDNETEIVNKVVTETEENDIILLHDCYLSSVKAALRIIDIMQAKGYEFVTVDELLCWIKGEVLMDLFDYMRETTKEKESPLPPECVQGLWMKS